MPRVLSIALAIGLAVVVSGCAHPRPVTVESHYTDAMYVRALENSSTAPDYVLITVVDSRDGTARLVCTEAPCLEGALHMEFDIPYDEAGQNRVHEMALMQSDRVFRLSKPNALRNVKPRYTPRELDSVRALIAGRPDSDLLSTKFVDMLQRKTDCSNEAIAHALLERGIGCVRTCIEAELRPYKSDGCYSDGYQYLKSNGFDKTLFAQIRRGNETRNINVDIQGLLDVMKHSTMEPQQVIKPVLIVSLETGSLLPSQAISINVANTGHGYFSYEGEKTFFYCPELPSFCSAAFERSHIIVEYLGHEK
jgi:hypothetical protein